MAEIAVASDQPGALSIRSIAQGDGWSVSDVTCTHGPRDRSAEERHSYYSIAIVQSGTFQYRSGRGCELMYPGSLMLGNAGQCFSCSHDHAAGDRCLSFRYSEEFFHRISTEAGAAPSERKFPLLRLPFLRDLSPLLALTSAADPDWEAIALDFAWNVTRLSHNFSPSSTNAAPSAIARVTHILRSIEDRPSADLSLAALAAEARLSRFHFLRVFEQLTNLTPHQYVRRARLRFAAQQIAAERGRITDVALDSGFADLSAFHHAFRAEFGASPRRFRAKLL